MSGSKSADRFLCEDCAPEFQGRCVVAAPAWGESRACDECGKPTMWGWLVVLRRSEVDRPTRRDRINRLSLVLGRPWRLVVEDRMRVPAEAWHITQLPGVSVEEEPVLLKGGYWLLVERSLHGHDFDTVRFIGNPDGEILWFRGESLYSQVFSKPYVPMPRITDAEREATLLRNITMYAG